MTHSHSEQLRSRAPVGLLLLLWQEVCKNIWRRVPLHLGEHSEDNRGDCEGPDRDYSWSSGLRLVSCMPFMDPVPCHGPHSTFYTSFSFFFFCLRFKNHLWSSVVRACRHDWHTVRGLGLAGGCHLWHPRVNPEGGRRAGHQFGRRALLRPRLISELAPRLSIGAVWAELNSKIYSDCEEPK